MKFFSVFMHAAVAYAGSSLRVTYDEGYDRKERPMTEVACSDGQNGLITRFNWDYQGNIPSFPYIGGSSSVSGWGSDKCGSCLALKYQSKTIYVLAIDHADSGLNIAKKALDDLTGGHAVDLGFIDADVKEVGMRQCLFGSR